MQQIIGIGGPIGAGKSFLGKQLAETLGLDHIEVDKLGHDALVACKLEVEQAFGTSDRKELAGLVFADRGKLGQLEAILHPWIRLRLHDLVTEARRSEKGLIINAALLFSAGLDKVCDTILWIKAPQKIRLERVIVRDSAKRDDILQRIAAQNTLAPKGLQYRADTLVVMNRCARRSLRACTAFVEYRDGKKQANINFWNSHCARPWFGRARIVAVLSASCKPKGANRAGRANASAYRRKCRCCK